MITPAVSRDEWMRWRAHEEVRLPIRGGARTTPTGDLALFWEGTVDIPREDFPAIIAVMNAILPDHHERKITRQWIACLRSMASHSESGDWGYLPSQIADVLESYLPPEELEPIPLPPQEQR